jgi:hypothetical protein
VVDRPRPGVQKPNAGLAYSMASAAIHSKYRASPSSKPPMIHNTPDAKSQKNIRWKFLLSGADLPRDLFRAITTNAVRPTCMLT